MAFGADVPWLLLVLVSRHACPEKDAEVAQSAEVLVHVAPDGVCVVRVLLACDVEVVKAAQALNHQCAILCISAIERGCRWERKRRPLRVPKRVAVGQIYAERHQMSRLRSFRPQIWVAAGRPQHVQGQRHLGGEGVGAVEQRKHVVEGAHAFLTIGVPLAVRHLHVHERAQCVWERAQVAAVHEVDGDVLLREPRRAEQRRRRCAFGNASQDVRCMVEARSSAWRILSEVNVRVHARVRRVAKEAKELRAVVPAECRPASYARVSQCRDVASRAYVCARVFACARLAPEAKALNQPLPISSELE